jgi:hypothetical protein
MAAHPKQLSSNIEVGKSRETIEFCKITFKPSLYKAAFRFPRRYAGPAYGSQFQNRSATRK